MGPSVCVCACACFNSKEYIKGQARKLQSPRVGMCLDFELHFRKRKTEVAVCARALACVFVRS